MEERMRSACPLGLRRPCSACSGRLPQGRLGAARVPRQDHLRRHGAQLGRGLLPLGLHPARPDAPALFSPRFKSQAGRLRRLRGVPPPRRQGRHRRPAGADPVPRPQDLPGRRHQHQGRPRQHGPFAGGARAADGPQAGRMAGHAALRPQDPGRKASTCSRRRWSRTCRTTCCTARRWASRCRWRAGAPAPNKPAGPGT
jgi:hypothetical protein